MDEIGLFEAMYTARALRRLKPDPVPEALINKVLDAAIRAPSGGNAQNWIFIVVRDAAQRRLAWKVSETVEQLLMVMRSPNYSRGAGVSLQPRR